MRAGSGTPATMAGWSGAAAAAARRTPPTVVGSTRADWSAGQYEIVTVVTTASLAPILARLRAGRT